MSLVSASVMEDDVWLDELGYVALRIVEGGDKIQGFQNCSSRPSWAGLKSMGLL